MSDQIRSARAAGSALQLTSDARNSASMKARSEVLANRASGIWLPPLESGGLFVFWIFAPANELRHPGRRLHA
jgi:hypothetical protein